MLPRRTGHSALPLRRHGRGWTTALVAVLGFALIAPVARADDSGYVPSTWTGVQAGAPEAGTGLPPAQAPALVTALPGDYDVTAEYEGQAQCDPTPKPGAQRLSDIIKQTYGADQTVWIPRACGVGGQSEHKEGRALDWMTSVRKAQQRSNAETFLNWLLGPDEAGQLYGHATRLGIMYVMWNDRIWRAYDKNKGWTEAKGCFSQKSTGSDTVCHRDHIHISLTWDGATGTTSFWDGSSQTAGYCPRDTSGATTPEPNPSGDMVGVNPVRVLDTAAGLGVPGRCRLEQDRFSGDSHRLYPKVIGVGDVPNSGVSGVKVRITAVNSNAPAKIRAWSPGQSKSQVAVQVGINATAASEVVVPVASDGTIALATSAGATDIVVEVLGYYRSGANGPAASTGPVQSPKPSLAPIPNDFFPMGSVVSYESAAQGGPLQADEERTVGLAGLPGEARSALIFVTSKEATKRGSVRIGRVDDKNVAATFSFPKKMHKAVMLVPVSGGQVTLKNSSAGAVQLRVEVLGYGTGTTPPTPVAMSPRSMFSTKVKAGQVTYVDAAKKFGLPGTKKLRAVLMRVSTTKATQSGTAYLYASDGKAPATRSAPIMANAPYAAMILAPVGADGRIAISSTVDAKVAANVVGYLK